MKRAIYYAVEGWKEVVSHHANIQRQLSIAVVVILLGGITKLSLTEWAILLLTIGMVLSLEMANSSIESVVNLVTKERRLDAKIAKDISAGMVLFASVISIMIGALLFIPKLWVLFE